jgi:hypothetical protein
VTEINFWNHRIVFAEQHNVKVLTVNSESMFRSLISKPKIFHNIHQIPKFQHYSVPLNLKHFFVLEILNFLAKYQIRSTTSFIVTLLPDLILSFLFCDCPLSTQTSMYQRATGTWSPNSHTFLCSPLAHDCTSLMQRRAEVCEL